MDLTEKDDCPEGTDSIVEELGVFLSQEYANNLYILQYPLRPTWRLYNWSSMSSVTFHPSINHVEMQLPLQSGQDDAPDYSSIDELEGKDAYLTLSGVPVNEHGPYAVGAIQTYEGARILVLHPVVAHLMVAAHQKSLDEPSDMHPPQPNSGDEMMNPRAINDVGTLSYTQGVTLRHFDQTSISSRELFAKLHDTEHLYIQNSNHSITNPVYSKAPRLVSYTVDRNKYINSFSIVEIQERERAIQLVDKLKTILDPKRRMDYCIREFRIVSFKSLRQVAQIPGREPPSHELIYNTLVSRTVFIHGWFAIKSEFVVTGSLVPFLDYLLLLLGLNTTGLSDENSLLHVIMQLKKTISDMQEQNKAYLGLLSSIEKQQEQIGRQVLQACMKDEVKMCKISRKAFTKETGLPANNILLMFRETGLLIPDKESSDNDTWTFKKEKQKDLGDLPVSDAEREVAKWIDATPTIINAMNCARKMNKLRKMQDQGLVRDTLTDVSELSKDVLEQLYQKYHIE
ncbi:Sin-like protein conserved region [Giardia duodenalis]|uniref:Sin-like protein conserved region n=1 Tax=Giardia intestinalis TaxID=5741 RepID=V6TNM1_GIAIN|nr:Sin-like protein conserved region [Giardia intestinalis]